MKQPCSQALVTRCCPLDSPHGSADVKIFAENSLCRAVVARDHCGREAKVGTEHVLKLSEKEINAGVQKELVGFMDCWSVSAIDCARRRSRAAGRRYPEAIAGSGGQGACSAALQHAHRRTYGNYLPTRRPVPSGGSLQARLFPARSSYRRRSTL